VTAAVLSDALVRDLLAGAVGHSTRQGAQTTVGLLLPAAGGNLAPEFVVVDDVGEFAVGRHAPDAAQAALAVEWLDGCAHAVAVSHDGRSFRLLQTPDGEELLVSSQSASDRKVAGAVPDALRRWMGLPTAPPSASPAQHLIWMWLDLMSWGRDATEDLEQAELLLARPDRRIALRMLRLMNPDPHTARQVMLELMQPLRALPPPSGERATVLIGMLPSGTTGADRAAAALLEEAWLHLVAISWDEAASVAADTLMLDTDDPAWEWMDGPMRCRAAFNRARHDPPRLLTDAVPDRAEMLDASDLMRWVGADLTAAQPGLRLSHQRLAGPSGVWMVSTWDDGDVVVRKVS
jgi:hypothetical protein